MKNFKKIFFVIFLLTIFSSLKANSEVVNKIDVKGNERISLETIVIFGDIIIGKNYESADINSLIKKLYESNFFSNISVELKNNKLTINVKENPIINSIIFEGEKAEKNKDKIREVLILKEKNSFIENDVKRDINQIKVFYRTLGFYFVKIDAKIEKLSRNKVNILYKVDKGDKAKIAKIYFLGDKKIRDKKLRDIITSQESRFWKFISRNVYLNIQRIELDKRLLKNYYRNQGYYEASITSSNVEYSEGEGFILTYSIEAGKRYRFNKIYASVSEALDQNALLSLENEFSKLIGKYYSQIKLNNILEEIDKLTEQKELQFINHNVLETLDGNGVEVKISIFEDEKIIIERINIVGNSITNDSVIRGEMIVDEGDPFSTLLVNKSINEIKARNIFGKVDYKMLPGTTEGMKVLEISIEERSTGEIMAGAGVGTDGTTFAFAISENNWLGRGLKLNTSLNLSKEQVTGSITVNNPNYNFTDRALMAGIDISDTDRSSTSGFKSSKTTMNLGTAYEQFEDVWFAPEMTMSFEDIEVDSSASTSIKKMEGNFINLDLLYGLTLDKRDQSFKPTEGYKVKFVQSLPLIQDSSSIYNSIDIKTYHDFSDDIIGSVKFLGRAITGIDDDVRLTERLYIPRNTLRGFEVRKVGPKDGQDYIGGNYLAGLSTEAQLPNLLPESYNTDFTVFLDTANIWGVDYSGSVDETSAIRSSVGIGANVYTVLGPLSFVFAQSLTKASEDETQSFSFNLGTSF
jgi:outer membrane protein insertion porin family